MIDIKKRIFITGVTGFVGANLLRRLVELGAEDLHVLIRQDANISRIADLKGTFMSHTFSLEDREETMSMIEGIRPEIIYHLAAAGTAVGRVSLGIDDLIRTNTLGTIHLIDAALAVGCQHFINTGSSSEYGQKDSPMSESDILEPNNLYGISKSGATQYASYMKQYKSFPIITYRLFAVYGPYEEMHRLIPILCRHVLEGTSPELSSPDSVRDFIYIEDVIEAYLRADSAIESALSVINLGTGTQYSIDEVVHLLRKITGLSLEPHYGVKSLNQLEPRMWKSDPTHMKKTLNLHLRSLEEGLSMTLDWMRSHT